MLLAPVADSIEDAARVGDFKSGQGDVAGREPAPIDGGEIAVTHDGLPQSVDTVVCFKGEEGRLVREGIEESEGEEAHRNVWHQCWYNSCPLCLEASRHRASNPRKNPDTAPGKRSCGWRSDSAADGTRPARRCIGRRCRGSIPWRWAAGARPSMRFEIHRLLAKKSGQGWPLVVEVRIRIGKVKKRKGGKGVRALVQVFPQRIGLVGRNPSVGRSIRTAHVRTL